MSANWIFLFLLGIAYPLVSAAIGLPACMFGFGVICALCAMIGFWLMPETRGKSHDQIMKMLTK